MPNIGDLRVWWASNVYNETYPVDDIDEAKLLIEKFTQEDLDNPSVTWNAGGLEEFDDELGWTEWYDDEYGEDIMGMINAKD